jgi:regulator of ribosome biosynthesis
MDVQQILASASAKYNTIHVTGKVIPPTVDCPNLAIIDINPLDSKGPSLLECTRDNVQLLINRIFDLPRKTDDSGVFAMLPASKTAIIPIPREKSLPKPKAKTTWERFAEKRGIKQTKKSKTSFDEASGEYLPSHGRFSSKNDPMNDWCREVPDGEDPFANQFEKAKETVGKKQQPIKKLNGISKSGKKQKKK